MQWVTLSCPQLAQAEGLLRSPHQSAITEPLKGAPIELLHFELVALRDERSDVEHAWFALTEGAFEPAVLELIASPDLASEDNFLLLTFHKGSPLRVEMRNLDGKVLDRTEIQPRK